MIHCFRRKSLEAAALRLPSIVALSLQLVDHPVHSTVLFLAVSFFLLFSFSKTFTARVYFFSSFFLLCLIPLYSDCIPPFMQRQNANCGFDILPFFLSPLLSVAGHTLLISKCGSVLLVREVTLSSFLFFPFRC